MSNIVLLIIILGKVENLTKLMLVGLMIYTVALVVLAMLLACDIGCDDKDKLDCIKDMMKKFKAKTILVILIITGIISVLIPTKEDLVLYYGSKQITVQNYHIAKDELLGFIKDIKNEIQNR